MRKNIIWNAFGNIVYLGFQWVVTVMVTRLMGLEDAGVLSLAMSISASFQTIALFGIRNYQVSDINSKYSDGCYVCTRIITCLLSLAMCITFTLISRYDFNQFSAVFWFMIYRLSENFSDVFQGIMQKNNRLDIAGKGFAIRGMVTIAAFFIGYLLSKNLIVSLMFMALGSAILTFLFDFAMAGKLCGYKLKSEKRLCWLLIREAIPLCAYTFFFSAISTAPKYILEKMYDESVLGAYSSIFAPALLIQAAASYIFVPFVGKFAELHNYHNLKALMKLVLKISFVIVIFALIIIVCAFLFGDWALKFLFGNTISEYTYLLFPILLCVIANSFTVLLCTLCVVVRAFKELVISNAAGLFFSCVLTPVFISKFGVNGTSYGLISGSLTACVLMIIAVCKCEFKGRKEL